MRRILSCIVSVLLCIPSFSQDDVVVMTVNGYDVSKSEFEYFFEKNNLENNISKKTVREYADLYLNFKLKVQAAIDEGLDKSESFINEYRMYRDMQAEEYLLDKDFLEKVARSSYEQSLAEIGETGLAHISVISAIPDEKNGRTLDECYERLNTVYDKLNAGESFRRMAYEYSDDDLAQNGGEAGWVSWKQLPQEVSEVVFSLEEGEYSKPFISDGAVFLIMVDERRQLGTYEQNRFDIDNWMRETGVYDESKRKVANEYAARLGWTIRDEEAVAHLDSVLEDVFATITEQHLFFGHVVDFRELYREDALFAFVVNTGVKAKLFGVKILDGVKHFLRRFKVEFVSVQVVHVLPFTGICPDFKFLLKYKFFLISTTRPDRDCSVFLRAEAAYSRGRSSYSH